MRYHPSEAAAYEGATPARIDRVQNALSHLAEYGDAYIVPTEHGELIAIAERWTDERRAERIAAAAGADLRWHDQYIGCDNCGIYIELDPHLSDHGLIWISECEVICRHCLETVPGMAVSQLEELARRQQYDHYAVPGYAETDPTQHGYIEVASYRYAADLPQDTMPWQSGAFVAQAFGKFSIYGHHDRYALYAPEQPDNEGYAVLPPAYDVQAAGDQWAVTYEGEIIPGLDDYSTQAEAIAAAWECELFGEEEQA